jgi:RNA-directed DNA polymerase
MSTQLSQIAKKAKLDRTVRFTSLAHLLTPEFLTETWGMMNRRAASGIDGESTEQFESELKQRVEEICAQLRAGAYRAPPVRRVEIPKGPGKTGTSIGDPHGRGSAAAAGGSAHYRGGV